MLKKVQTAYTVNISRIKLGCPYQRIRNKTATTKALPPHVPSRGGGNGLVPHRFLSLV